MTHPDILKIETFGTDYPGEKIVIGKCVYCGAEICADDRYIETYDDIFCDEDCFYEYYGAEVVNGE